MSSCMADSFDEHMAIVRYCDEEDFDPLSMRAPVGEEARIFGIYRCEGNALILKPSKVMWLLKDFQQGCDARGSRPLQLVQLPSTTWS